MLFRSNKTPVDLAAGQHLAHLRQEASEAIRADSVPQHLAQAALEAHLARHQQAALAVVQALEQQRLRP